MMKKYDFDSLIPRRNSDSVKWKRYPEDVLPLWVADMDFPSPPEIIEAMNDRLKHPFFGYGCIDDELLDVICQWVFSQHGWKIKPDWILCVPGVVAGMNWAVQSMLQKGEKVCFQTPVYPPFFRFADYAGAEALKIPLLNSGERFLIDFDLFSKNLDENTKLFALCNPHNPVGRVFSTSELEKMAEICLKKDMLICADEIHCDLVFSGNKHIPIASLSEEIANNTITLMAPSKTFNIPGLHFSYAIVSNPEIRKKMESTRHGLVGHPGLLAYSASKAAYQFGEEWLKELLRYLEGNRDFLGDYLKERLPAIKSFSPEGTYLAWLDCRTLNLGGDAQQFFLEKAKVALNNGKDFGVDGKGFVRLNFGTPRSVLEEALDKMKSAIIGKK